MFNSSINLLRDHGGILIMVVVQVMNNLVFARCSNCSEDILRGYRLEIDFKNHLLCEECKNKLGHILQSDIKHEMFLTKDKRIF